MHICIGGDLDGKVVTNRESAHFSASEIDSIKQSTYNRQTYIVGGTTYRFWLCGELPFVETTRIANKYLAEKFRYLS